MTKEEFKGFSSAAQHDMVLDATNDNRKGSRNTFSEMTNAKEKIESAQQSSGNFMSCKSSTDTTSYPDELVKRS